MKRFLLFVITASIVLSCNKNLPSSFDDSFDLYHSAISSDKIPKPPICGPYGNSKTDLICGYPLYSMYNETDVIDTNIVDKGDTGDQFDFNSESLPKKDTAYSNVAYGNQKLFVSKRQLAIWDSFIRVHPELEQMQKQLIKSINP